MPNNGNVKDGIGVAVESLQNTKNKRKNEAKVSKMIADSLEKTHETNTSIDWLIIIIRHSEIRTYTGDLSKERPRHKLDCIY